MAVCEMEPTELTSRWYSDYNKEWTSRLWNPTRKGRKVTPPRTAAGAMAVGAGALAAAATTRGLRPPYPNTPATQHHRSATATVEDDDDDVTKEKYDDEDTLDDDEVTKETYDDDEVTKETYDTKDTYGDEHTYNTHEDGTAATREGTLDSSYRSVASTYTKSAEGEVEDIIKDIFMIGSGQSTVPGRRRVVRRDNETVDTYGNTLPIAAHSSGERYLE